MCHLVSSNPKYLRERFDLFDCIGRDEQIILCRPKRTKTSPDASDYGPNYGVKNSYVSFLRAQYHTSSVASVCCNSDVCNHQNIWGPDGIFLRLWIMTSWSSLQFCIDSDIEVKRYDFEYICQHVKRICAFRYLQCFSSKRKHFSDYSWVTFWSLTISISLGICIHRISNRNQISLHSPKLNIFAFKIHSTLYFDSLQDKGTCNAKEIGHISSGKCNLSVLALLQCKWRKTFSACFSDS